MHVHVVFDLSCSDIFLIPRIQHSWQGVWSRQLHVVASSIPTQGTAMQWVFHALSALNEVYCLVLYSTVRTVLVGSAVLLCFVVCLTLLASFFLPSHLSLTRTIHMLQHNNNTTQIATHITVQCTLYVAYIRAALLFPR